MFPFNAIFRAKRSGMASGPAFQKPSNGWTLDRIETFFNCFRYYIQVNAGSRNLSSHRSCSGRSGSLIK